MAPSPEKQAGKLLGLLAQEGRQYGDLVAERLVELVRSEPLEGRDDLHRQLVAGAATYLCHTAWYARVSAAACLESLARLEYGQEEPSRAAVKKKGGGGGDALTDELARGWVGLGDVRLAEVLERGALLLSHGEDADVVDSERATPSADVGTRVGRQRKRLLKCLGLAGGSGEARAGSLYSSIGDAIEDEDIEGPAANAKRGSSRGGGRTKPDGPISAASDTPTTVGGGCSGSGSGDGARQQLSARQRNRLAREARSNAAAAAGRSASRGGGGGGVKGKRRAGGEDHGDRSDGGGEDGREDGPPAFLGRGATGSMMTDVASNAREALVSLAADLVAQLFHPIWQCRHGAALGALSILRAWNARRRRGEPVPYGARMAAWAEDAVARCVCVLALDRFGDYSSRMVAPVRETAAQLLAVAALQLEADKLRQAARLLFELTASGEWQARHGGFCSLESLCAVAITGDGADGRGAPPEVSPFLHGLVYRAAPRGLSDPAEDVCAAAARAVRLVMRRFLPPPVEAGRDNHGGEAGLTLAPAGRQRRERGPTGDAEGEAEVWRSCGGGGEVFDLVWKALEDLDQDSTCVEDLADLLETCCEDVGRASGATDPFLSSGERRLNRLLDLWEDVRAGVRACAVRSLLALAQGIVGATRPVTKTQSVGESAAAATRCERLLLRCFQALLSERDDGVREHSARLWSELLKGLGRADGHRRAAHASLMASCLGILFAPPATPPPPTTAMEDVTTPASATADSAASSSPASTRPARRRPSKRARGETSGSPEDVAAFSTARPPSKHQNRAVQADTIAEGPAGAGASATFFGRLASAGALAELARASASAAAAADGEEAAARGDGASATGKAGSSGCRGSSSGKRARAGSDGHGSASDGETEGVVAAKKTARELAMSEVARRAGSGWAWEQELAFFLMEACCAGGGVGARGGSGGGSTSTRGDEVPSKAEQDAWAAVDRALATKDDAAAVGHKVFKELEGVDKAVSAACSGVIRVLLQAAGGSATTTAGAVEQAAPAARSATSNKGVTTATSSTAAGSQRANAAARKPPKGGKSRSQGTAKAATVRGSSARSRSTAPVPPTATPAPLQGAASVERTFQSLAAAFGETLVPVDRGATREEREAVWTGRVRHFHARIQAQQAVLTRRITSAAASVYAGVRPLPPELNPVLRPLVSAVKKEPDAQRRGLSASRLARLATALLGDAVRSERRDAGAMVLFGLASLSGKGQQQSLNSPATAAAAATEETLMAVEVACDGATEMLRHAVSLASSSSAAPTAPVPPPVSPASAARPLPAPGSSRSDVGSGGGRGEGIEEVVKGGGREGGRRRGGRGGKAVRDWALRTLAPLLRHPSGMGAQGGNTIGAGTTALPWPQRKLSAAEKKKSAAEIRAIDLSAALGVAEALLQAARDRTAAAAAAANPHRGARPLLGSLLLETSLAAGLLALARSGRVPVSGEDEGADISAEPTRGGIPLRQHHRSGGDAGNAPDGGTPSVDGGGHAAAVAAATADAALIIARDAADLFPDGLWEGLRSDLLPALAAGACSGDVGGSGVSGGSFGGGGGIGVAGDVRAGLVLKEVVGGMGTGVVPYAARLLPVALRGMTDANEDVRGLLAGTFNELVKAVALAADDADDDRHAGDHKGGEDLGDGGVSTERTIDGQLHGQGEASAAAAAARVGEAAGDSVEEDGELIARHLVRGEPLPRLHRGLLPEALERKAAAGVTIRPYQWEGIAWLDFLRRIGAHGILADDMGLGKTLQALMAVAMCHHHHPGRRSLVVCPSILVHHWKAECSRYFGDGLLRPVAYAGPPQARRRLAGRLGLGPAGNDKDRNGTSGGADGSQGPGADGATASAAAEEEEEPERANVVITSYNVLRTDAEVLGKQGWLYLVLDEAHLLRNPATRTAKAARALRSNHRVGLTGTPIQNSVLELWSLFEFLMPGYLGDRRSFQRDVARPVRAALSSDGDGRATVEGLQQLEKLHRQVLPFVLRREKSEVLADLPSKIITEMVCDLTPEQRRLHNIWERGGDGGRVLAAVAQAEEMEAARLRAVASAAVAATAAAAAATATSERPAESTGHVNGPTTAAPTSSPASGGDNAAGDGGAATADSQGKKTTTEASRAAAPTGRLSAGAQTLACLSKLQLLCVHPSLVTPEEGTKRREMSADVKLSGKLMALRELLWDAGIGKRQTSVSFGGGGGGGGSGESSSGSESVDIGSSDSDTGTMDDSSSDDNEEEEEEEEEEERAERAVNDGKRQRSLEQRQSSSDSRKRGRNSRGRPEGGGSRAGHTNPNLAKAGPNSSTSSPGKPDTKRSTVGTAGSSARAARSSSSRAPAESTGKGGKPPPTTTTRGKGSLPRQEEATTAGDGVASPLPGRKCLVFAQHKAALDVTESALLRPCFPGVKYLRMDGSVSQAERAAAVDRFSADPSVAILLLTTRVGHLGLNLSAASMVVFLEHDWNPQVDLQAMDRAHRLGQRKAVNVYRLIAADSVEQRVLRLQGHKLQVAAAVVSRENASAFSSGTGGVLGMLGEAMAVVAAANKKKDGGGGDDGESVELWSADEDYAYLAAERLADSVARE